MAQPLHEADLAPVRAPLRTEELFEALQRRILSDEWPAGSRLPGERELAEVFGTNRNTLREALRRLEQAGLVTVRHGQGVTVCDFRRTGGLELVGPFLVAGSNPGEKARLLLDVLEPRKRVLEYTIERFVERFAASDLKAVEDAVREVRAAEAARDPRALIMAEARMIELLVDGTHDQIVRWLSRPLLELTREVQQRWPSIVVFDPSLSRFATQLLDACAARDRARAVASLRSHYDAIDVNVRAILQPLVESAKGALP